MLVLNTGSSSLKLTLLDGARTLAASELLPAEGTPEQALERALAELPQRPQALGHRIVHGGERFRGPVAIDADVRAALEELVDLAPLHQRRALAALDAAAHLAPELPAVACFDTAFHATIPPAAATYAIPSSWRERWGLRRFGFHGLSHAWIARRAPQLLGADPARLRIVSAHLGAGASLCAIRGGVSVETTMGFTPLEGLVMATRSGSVDPGLLLWLLEREHVPAAEMAQALEHESGLLGLSGSADMREVLAGAAAGPGRCALAVDVYVHRLRAAVAAMAAALGGLDVLAFTGGVGERSAEIRARTAAGLAFLGVELDIPRNEAADGDADVSTAGASASTLVLRAREDLEIARQVHEALGG